MARLKCEKTLLCKQNVNMGKSTDAIFAGWSVFLKILTSSVLSAVLSTSIL